MRRAKDVIGLPVLTFRTGRKIDEVKDILFDPEHNRILALLTDDAGWFTDARVIPFDQVKSLGRDAVIVEDETAEIPASSRSDVRRAIEGKRIIINMRVFTEDGRDIGTIGDMFLDEKTGEVLGYEVSGGFLAATLRGKQFMPAPETMVVGRDVTYVPSETGTRMEQEVTGGIQKGIQEAQAAAGRTAEQARAAAAQAAEAARAQTDELLRQSTSQQKRYVIGKPVGLTIKTPDGKTILREGDIVSQSDADVAERTGVLGQLVSSVASAQAGAAAARARETAERQTRELMLASADQQKRYVVGKRAGSTVRSPGGRVIVRQGDVISQSDAEAADNEGVLPQLVTAVTSAEAGVVGAQVQRGATQAFEDVRRTFVDIGREAEEETQRARIKGALGRPATRVILDEKDNVILNTGDIVTHEAIDRARSAGVLDILLASVSTEKPSFSLEQRRIRESGEATHPGTEMKGSPTRAEERTSQHKTEEKSHHGHEEKRKK
ncbi:MAG: PRC-barrel domain-containing protein [Chloroflexota bacterium]